MKVFINPGHAPNGCPDPGAVNKYFNQKESEMVAIIANEAAEYLKQAGVDSQILQSNNLCGESFGPCICDEANASGADILVSIHCNAFNGEARGCETMCYSRKTGGELAECIQYQVWDTMKDLDPLFPDRGVKERTALAVLKYTTMPAVLLEVAFIDNAEDALLMMFHHKKIAAAIARGITDYWYMIAHFEDEE